MALETMVAPTIEPVTLTQARAFFRVGTDGDDGVLTSLLIAAREALEARTGRALITRTLRQGFKVPTRSCLLGTFVPGRIPVSNVVAVSLIGADGTQTPAPASLVRLMDGRFVVTEPLSASVAGLSIDYQAGYSTSEAGVPEAFKVSILEAVADVLERRDNSNSDGGNSWDDIAYEVKL